jgi:hypothetical protein
VKPYLVSILPVGAIQGSRTTTSHPQATSHPVVQVRSTLSLAISQTVEYPFAALKSSKATAAAQYTLRLLTPAPFGKSPLFLISSPNDRNTLATEGAALWMFSMREWNAQIDELVTEYKYSEALALLDSLEEGVLLDKVSFVDLHGW